MIGFPTETEETIQESITFAKKLPLNDISVFLLTPFPGTELYRSAHQYGVFKKDWKSMSMFIEPCFIPHGLTREKMLAYSLDGIKAIWDSIDFGKEVKFEDGRVGIIKPFFEPRLREDVAEAGVDVK